MEFQAEYFFYFRRNQTTISSAEISKAKQVMKDDTKKRDGRCHMAIRESGASKGQLIALRNVILLFRVPISCASCVSWFGFQKAGNHGTHGKHG